MNSAANHEVEEKYMKMTTRPIPGLVVSMAVPTIISMLVNAIYNLADTFFVAKISTDATAAVGVVFALMTFLQAIGFTFGHGSGNYMSRAMGRQDYKAAKTMAATAVYSALFFGFVIMAAGLIFLEPLCRFMGAPTEVLDMTMSYAKWIFIGSPYMIGAFVINNQLRFQGNAFYAMIGIVSGVVINLALDPLFIFVFHMGVEGAALATIISQFISFWLLVIGTLHKDTIRLNIKNMKPSVEIYRQILKGGFPSLCRQGIMSVATMCLNHIAGLYSVVAIAALSIVNRVTMLTYSAMIGFGQGFQPVCGFNYGAKKYNRVIEAAMFSVKVSAIGLGILAVFQFIFAPQVIRIFRNDNLELISIGVATLRFQCITFPLASWITICNMMTQTIGKTVSASILAVAKYGIFFIPMLFILSPLGVLGLEMSQMVADILAFILALFIGKRAIGELKRLEMTTGKVEE